MKLLSAKREYVECLAQFEHWILSTEIDKGVHQLPLRRTPSEPSPTVRLIEVSALEGDEANDWSTAGSNSTCPLKRGVRFNEVSVKRELTVLNAMGKRITADV